MTTVRDFQAPDAPTAPCPARRPRRQRRLRFVGALFVVGTAALVASTATNLILERVEQSQITPYGHRISVGNGALNVVQNGQSGPPLVLLSGLGTAAPGLDFAPLVRQLDDYSVTIVENFGYGYSDQTAPARTVENITAELHDVHSQLEIPQPYTLIGHSIGGFYTLHYAHTYPSEVAAVVGIDPTVPAAKAAAPTGAEASASAGPNWQRMLGVTGLVRVANTLLPALAEPAGDAFTPSEREDIRLMTSWNFGNDALANETALMGHNAQQLQGISYADDLPVLTFLASDSLASIPGWRESHETQLKNVTQHELVELEGGHYLHWTQSEVMAETITEFLTSAG